MKDSEMDVLIGEITKSISLLNRINGKYLSFSEKRDAFPVNFDLVVLAEI